MDVLLTFDKGFIIGGAATIRAITENADQSARFGCMCCIRTSMPRQ